MLVLCSFFVFLISFQIELVSSTRQMEKITFECGLRKPYKALFLEIEPSKMKKTFSLSDQFFLFSRKIFWPSDNIFLSS